MLKLESSESGIGYPRYSLKKSMLGLKAGTIFEHRPFDSRRTELVNNMGKGFLVLAEDRDGWYDGDYVLPAQLVDDTTWFERKRAINLTKYSVNSMCWANFNYELENDDIRRAMRVAGVAEASKENKYQLILKKGNVFSWRQLRNNLAKRFDAIVTGMEE